MMWGNKFIKNLFSIVISVGVVTVAASFISAKVINEKDEMDVSSSFSIPDVPSKVSFAGETIELNRYDLYERYERELTATCYMHSTTLLTLKRANRYMPVIEPILKNKVFRPTLYTWLPSKVISIHGHTLVPERPVYGSLCQKQHVSMDLKLMIT